MTAFEGARGTVVGTSIPRVDGVDKVTGRAQYVDDLRIDGMLHGVTVRSRVPHGRLLAVECDPSFDWDGVTVVTAEHIPGQNVVALIEEDQPALVPVGGTIRHWDEPVALVAAADRKRAVEAANHVRMNVEPLPSIHSIEDSVDCKVVLHGDDNVQKRFRIAKGGDIEGALAASDIVLDHTYRTGAQEQMYIEPQGLIGLWDQHKCHIIGSMQCPYYIHKAMKVLLAIAPEDIVITQAVTGGGFGGKEEYPSMLAAHVALLARAAGAPVKMIYDRQEDIAATTKRHPSVVRHRMGVNRDGTIVAIDVDVLIDGGAYVTLSPVVLSRAVLHAAGPYKCDTVRIVGRSMATNTPPHGAFRGFGAPQTTFAYERQMAKAALALGVDPLEFRRANVLRSGDATATSQVLTQSVGSDAVVQAVAIADSDRPLKVADDGMRRGRGVAVYFHGAGFTGSGEARLAGRAELACVAGGRFEVRSSSTDLGQGAFTTFVQIAAAALGVDPKLVSVVVPSTDKVPDSGPTVASRTCMVVGSVVATAARGLRRRMEAWAKRRGIGERDLSGIGAAMVEAEGEVAEMAQYSPPPGIAWDDDTYTGSAYPVFGWAACLVDVAVDPDTYEVTVERCVHAVDVGKAIHPTIVKGQIEGGTLQALGWALLENVVYRDGRVANSTMTDCIVPTAADAPDMETILVEEPYAFGPHGAKGVGELPMDGPAAAVANALVDAVGGEFDVVPMLPEVIERVVNGGKRDVAI